MRWVIQEDVFDENYIEDMEEALGNLGLARGQGYEVIKYIPFADPATYLPIQPDNDVIVYGSINLLKQVQQHTKWKPGACVSWNNYRYSSYFPFYNNYVYNRTPGWFPLEEMVKRVDRLFETPMWIKSDAGDKAWTGGVYTKEEFLYEVDFRLSNGLSADTPMVIDVPSGPNYGIEKEWRIFCIQKNIITGSQYGSREKKDVAPGVPHYIMDYAKKILDSVYYTPDPVFALDICQVLGRPYLLELSAFNCAGFYGCDIKKLITEVHNYYENRSVL
jgi:hypothetical protein